MRLGKRGEGWVILQFFIFGLLIYTSRFHFTDLPLWIRYSGGIFLAIGGFLGTNGILNLGKNLSPFPRPRDSAFLVTHGVYHYVRHPIYSGLIIGTFGWSLIISNFLGFFMVVVLFLFFDLKSRREEQMLTERFPEYTEYRQHVKKLLPWIY